MATIQYRRGKMDAMRDDLSGATYNLFAIFFKMFVKTWKFWIGYILIMLCLTASLVYILSAMHDFGNISQFTYAMIITLFVWVFDLFVPVVFFGLFVTLEAVGMLSNEGIGSVIMFLRGKKEAC